MPDKYPLCPGHTLIITKEHLACFGAASPELHRELEEAATAARAFLGAAYAKPLFTWENGIAGQSVYHAHLHLMPLAIAALPDELEQHPDVASIESWEEVRDHFARDASYRYLELGGQRRLLRGHTPALRSIVHLLANATGLRYGRSGWIKTSTPEDVSEVGQRYGEWRRKNRE
jgi:diadenosine tetraphosphate (Ap4A) HIT family hydrolase